MTSRAATDASISEAASLEETVVSPFDSAPPGADGDEEEGEEEGPPPELPMTRENVELVLEEVRPYLRSDGGDCEVLDIAGSIVYLELQGSCSSCSSSAITLKMGIERTLRERIPEITEVIAASPDQESLSEAGIESVLDEIRPFLKASGGTIELGQFDDGTHPRVTLVLTGPALKSTAVRVEVTNRLRQKYPLVQQVDITGAADAS